VRHLGLTRGIKDDFFEAIRQSEAHNPWFTEANIRQALSAIATQMLRPDELRSWLAQYPILQEFSTKSVGIIMAGNLPLVSFHDLLCALASGRCAVVKLSSKDKFLLPMLAKYICQIDYRFEGRIRFANTLCDVDVVIATGSNNSARYFHSEYGHLPHLFRQSRTSIGVVSGSELDDELQLLAHDALDYFGMGCRSVGKIFVPQGFDISRLQQIFATHADLRNHIAYNNCCRYAQAMHAMRSRDFIDFGSCIASFCNDLHSPIGELFLQTYTSLDELHSYLTQHQSELQCVSTATPIASFEHLCVPLGHSQIPRLTDYADGVDVMEFLGGLEL
jgi:hypothetical protein